MSADADSAIPAGPFPASEVVQSILLFGGSFDPPHRGHFELPALVRDAVRADWIFYIPAARSPLKSDGPTATGEERIAMLRAGLAERGENRAGISTLELDRAMDGDGASYTIDTLRDIQKRINRDVSLRLLIGADQAREFHRWREAHEILRVAEPVVMLRAGDVQAREELIAAMRHHWSEDELARWGVRIVPLPLVEASSTEIRRIFAEQGPDDPRLRELIPGAVLDVIRAGGLYTT